MRLIKNRPLHMWLEPPEESARQHYQIVGLQVNDSAGIKLHCWPCVYYFMLQLYEVQEGTLLDVSALPGAFKLPSSVVRVVEREYAYHTHGGWYANFTAIPDDSLSLSLFKNQVLTQPVYLER